LLDKLIWHLETYDIISVRASANVSKAITESGIKVVSGEGADEILEVICILEMRFRRGISKETIERVQKLFTADLLRADKSTMSQGLETRYRFR
jgi:asparagine synthase (glutamine-hydrolysing)